jgi:cellobiose-specific phosphotransferase system component IIC
MLYGVPFCLVVMLVLGYPLALLLKKSGKLSAFNLSVGAVLVGAVVAIVAVGTRPYGSLDIKLTIFGGAVGLFTAIVFCLVAGIPFRRPTP